MRQIGRRAPDDGDAGEMRRGRRGYDGGEVGRDRLGDDGNGGASRPPAPTPLAQAAGAGDERSDAFAALDRQHMAAVDDDTAAVAKRLQGVQQSGAARRIGDLPRFGRLGADLDERTGKANGAAAAIAAPRSSAPCTNRPPASALRTSSARSRAMAPLASTATPRNPASSARTTVPGPMAGMSTRISWRGLGRLTSTPAGARRRPRAGALQGEPCQHGVGVLGAFDGLDASLGDDHRLPDVERPQRAHHIEAARDVDHLVRRRLQGAERALADEQRGQHVDRRDDLEALAFEEAHDAAQHAVVARGGDDARRWPAG